MDLYFVDREAKVNGDHEVHTADCARLPSLRNRHYLGSFPNCSAASILAGKYFSQINGCPTCCPECHNR